jgi:hypothetical protein
MSLDNLILAAIQGKLDNAAFSQYVRYHNIPLAEVFNAFALTIARRFLANTLSFEDADAAMNSLWQCMLPQTPEPAYAIFEAFDAGEFEHQPGVDPVDSITRPALRHILGYKSLFPELSRPRLDDFTT